MVCSKQIRKQQSIDGTFTYFCVLHIFTRTFSHTAFHSIRSKNIFKNFTELFKKQTPDSIKFWTTFHWWHFVWNSKVTRWNCSTKWIDKHRKSLIFHNLPTPVKPNVLCLWEVGRTPGQSHSDILLEILVNSFTVHNISSDLWHQFKPETWTTCFSPTPLLDKSHSSWWKQEF